MCSPLTICLTLATYAWIPIPLGCPENGDPKYPPTSEVQLAAVNDAAAAENGPWVPIPVTVGKATTRILGPLRPDGYVDYVEALRRHSRRGVTVKNNAAILIWQALGPSHIDAKYRQAYFEQLGHLGRRGHALRGTGQDLSSHAPRPWRYDREGAPSGP